MKSNIVVKNYAVYMDGRLRALFETEEEAKKFLAENWFFSIGEIYDNNSMKLTYTEVNIL